MEGDVKIAYELIQKSMLKPIDKSMVMLLARLEIIESYLRSPEYINFVNKNYTCILKNKIEEMQRIRKIGIKT